MHWQVHQVVEQKSCSIHDFKRSPGRSLTQSPAQSSIRWVQPRFPTALSMRWKPPKKAGQHWLEISSNIKYPHSIFFLISCLNRSCFSLHLLLLILQSRTTVKSLSLFSQWPPHRWWGSALRFPQSCLFCRLNKPGCLCLFSWVNGSSPCLAWWLPAGLGQVYQVDNFPHFMDLLVPQRF